MKLSRANFSRNRKRVKIYGPVFMKASYAATNPVNGKLVAEAWNQAGNTIVNLIRHLNEITARKS